MARKLKPRGHRYPQAAVSYCPGVRLVVLGISWA